MSSGDETVKLPLLPLREVVVFPGSRVPLIVGRARSVAAVTAARQSGGRIIVVAQRRGELDAPSGDDLYDIGTIATIEQILRLPDGNTKILIEGRQRARVVAHLENPDHHEATVVPMAPLDDAVESGVDEALVRSLKGTVERYVKLNRAAPPDMLMGVNGIQDPSRLADMLVGVIKLTHAERQELLELMDVTKRLERVYKALQNEIEFLQVERKLRTRVRRKRENTQREVWIDERVRAIQKELGDKDGRDDLEELAAKLAAKELPDVVRARAERDLRRLEQMNPMSAEATVVRNYLDWLVGLPWLDESELCTDLRLAATALDEAHYGLQEVKDRILEHLAVTTLAKKVQGPILCLVGPPGVGKTSFARSIAQATGRPFARIALGGVRDEAEIRGHRRTYIGAMPGRIVQAMKRAGAIDPVLLLDEVDKMSSDVRGDPSSALLEVLDPEQNSAFHDHYLDLDYDLSKVMFLCTANALRSIPLPMLDRLEIIHLSGYTEEEKQSIARRFLIPKVAAQAGLNEQQVVLPDAVLGRLVRRYTRESGVRGLDRQLAKVFRKIARAVVEDGADGPCEVTEAKLQQLLGPPMHDYGRREMEDQVGLVKGLSVSAVGGELLNIEVAAVAGKGKLTLTGRLGEVLKESGTAMFTYVRSRALALGLEPDFHETQDFHIHYPGRAGGVEGPSAGIAMATALVSALTGIPVRSDTAMTGEISLRGRVLPIGGVREKLLAAHRGGITRVLIPRENEKDLHDLPDSVRESLEVVVVEHMDSVLCEALSTFPMNRSGARSMSAVTSADGGVAELKSSSNNSQ